MSAVNRKRNVCSACFRRKIRCSKTFPCTQCVKRNRSESCRVDSSDTQPRGTSDRGDIAQLSQQQQQHQQQQHQQQQYQQQQHQQQQDLLKPPELIKDSGGGTTIPGKEKVANDLECSNQSSGLPPPRPLTPSSITSASPSLNIDDVEIEDAATILEFLAWGRSKRPADDDVLTVEADAIWKYGGDANDSATTSAVDIATYSPSVSPLLKIALLLPEPGQVWQLADYHMDCLLWYHGSFHAPTFRRQMRDFYNEHDGDLNDSNVNLQWVALLLSVLLATMTSSPQHTLIKLGYRPAEQHTLSKKWIKAIHMCLNLADYTGRHSVFSVQAIATMTMSAHLLGYSNQQSVLLASANRIAQSLGLHRLARKQTENAVEHETGRRLWSQLCQQDWFSIPFSESYSISPRSITSPLPNNYNDDTMDLLPHMQPTVNSYGRWSASVAYLMPHLHDDLASCNTPFTAYEQVLHYDRKLRDLAITQRPKFLSSGVLDPSWPQWASWARKAAAISSSHKIIMIHRKFLIPSFTNPFFSFTRATCIAASKTILKVFKEVVTEKGPTLWIHHAFTVAAGVTLCLDIRHRSHGDPEILHHQSLVREAIESLRSYPMSAIANRGICLLSTLLTEECSSQTPSSTLSTRKRKFEQPESSGPKAKRSKSFDITAFIEKLRARDASDRSSDSSDPSDRIDPTLADHGPEMMPLASAGNLKPRGNGRNRAGPNAVDTAHGHAAGARFANFSQGLTGGVESFEDLLFLASSYDLN